MALFKFPFVIVLNQLSDIAKIKQVNEIKDRVIITLVRNFGILNPKFYACLEAEVTDITTFFSVPVELLLSKLCYLYKFHVAEKTNK